MTTQGTGTPVKEQRTAAEIGLALGGASKSEIAAVGVTAAADEAAELLTDPKYRTEASPVYRAVFRLGAFPTDLFRVHSVPKPAADSAEVVADRQQKIQQGLHTICIYHREGNLYDPATNKVNPELKDALKKLGWWGLRVPVEYGGLGMQGPEFMKLLTLVSAYCPTLGGELSVNQNIGALFPVLAFGSKEQKRKHLPEIARGHEGCFGATEPGVGSDLSKVATEARLDGDEYVITGTKLFITNPVPGAKIGLVVRLVDRKNARGKSPLGILIFELPKVDCATFSYYDYELTALVHATNRGLQFKGHRVPKDSLLEFPSEKFDGFAMAMALLNQGRNSISANAAGVIRHDLAKVLPWTEKRESLGKMLKEHQLVQARLGSMAARIVMCDALNEWCASILAQGFRGEIEGIITKVQGAEAIKDSAVDDVRNIQGGRSYLKQNFWSQTIGDNTAPGIYEGSRDVLSLALMLALLKGLLGYLAKGPMGFVRAGVEVMKLLIIGPILGMLSFIRTPLGLGWRSYVPFSLEWSLRCHAAWAIRQFGFQGFRIASRMIRHMAGLQREQAILQSMSLKVMDQATVLVTVLYAANRDGTTKLAADVACRMIRRQTHGQQRDTDLQRRAALGRRVSKGLTELPQGIQPQEILFPWSSST